MSKIIGVEIGNDNLKLAICSGGKVQKLVCEKIPENIVQEDMILIPDAMSEFLRETRKKYKIGSAGVAVVLPEGAAYTRKFEIPAMNDAELRLNLPYEFKDYLDQEKGKELYVYDYCILDVEYEEEADEIPEITSEDGKKKNKAPAKKPKNYTVFAAAMKKDLIDTYASMFKKAGLKLQRAVPYDAAIQNLLLGKDNIPDSVAVLDIGANKAKLNIFNNGKYEMGRSFDIGGRYIDDMLAQSYKVDSHTAATYKETNFENCLSCDECVDAYSTLAVEVMKVLTFYRVQGNKIADIYFAGGSSLIEMLKTRVVKATELSPHDVTKLLSDIKAGDEALGVICHAAIGAAIVK